jgi:hypothetical protein
MLLHKLQNCLKNTLLMFKCLILAQKGDDGIIVVITTAKIMITIMYAQCN